jgi:predicted nucleic acid-binding protein
VKIFLDTSVLVRAFFEDHEQHESSFELFSRCEKHEACCGVHTLAEVYSALTGRPGKNRASQDEALLYISDIRENLSIITLTEDECFKAIEASAAASVLGGGIHDALLGQCALKSGAETIYTWNVKHFIRLGPEIARLVATP